MEMFSNTAATIMAMSNCLGVSMAWINDLYHTIQVYNRVNRIKLTHIQTGIVGLRAFQHIQFIIGEIEPVCFKIRNNSIYALLCINCITYIHGKVFKRCSYKHT